jgi:hypothetical protein
MTRVLVLATEVIPLPGLPTVGGGMRGWRLARGLESAGFEVTLIFPREAMAPYGDAISAEAREAVLPLTYAWLDPAGAIAEHQPDVVLCCSWMMASRLAAQGGSPVPLAVDVAGPVLIEALYQNPAEGTELAPYKVRGLRAADFVVCAGERQRAYFFPWLLLSGFTPHDCAARLATVTISAPPSPRPPHGPPNPEPLLIFAGVALPWHDPLVPLKAVAETITRHDRGRLELHLTQHPIHSQNATWYWDFLEWSKGYPRVTVFPGTPRPNAVVLDLYRSADLAFDLFGYNPERELAVAHRTVDYLSCGLPVLHSSYAELAGPIERYEAGATVDPADPDAIAAIVGRVLTDPALLGRWSANAVRMTDEYLAWDRTIAPLAAWCANPTRRDAAGALSPEALVPDLRDQVRSLEAEAVQFRHDRAGMEAGLDALRRDREALHGEVRRNQELADERAAYAQSLETAWQEQHGALNAVLAAPWRTAVQQTLRRFRNRT